MSKYQNLKVRIEIIDIIKSCQRPQEPLSDTLKAILDPLKIMERQKTNLTLGYTKRVA